MTVNNGLNFFLWVKLIRLNASGKALKPPCAMEPHFCIDLLTYIEDYRQEETTLYEAKEAVAEILRNLSSSFGCPVGWHMVAFRKGDPLQLVAEKHFKSKEFSYSPAHNQTEIDLSFINGWLFEKGEEDLSKEDFSDLYLDEDERRELEDLLVN